MICESYEMTGRAGTLPPPRLRPGPAPEPEIDLERLVWDPEYREQMRWRMKRAG